jgi:gas vesicle protein
MNKNIEKIILLFLFLVILYHLLNVDIIEGKRRRRRRMKRPKKIAKKIARAIPKKIVKAIPKKIVKAIPKQIRSAVAKNKNLPIRDDKKNKMQDYEINQLKKKIASIDTKSYIPELKLMQTSIDKNREEISKNNANYKSLAKSQFSKDSADLLQGTVDTISNNILNNNYKVQNRIQGLKSGLRNVSKRINEYERSNDDIEFVLGKLNQEIETKYVNKN